MRILDWHERLADARRVAGVTGDGSRPPHLDAARARRSVKLFTAGGTRLPDSCIAPVLAARVAGTARSPQSTATAARPTRAAPLP